MNFRFNCFDELTNKHDGESCYLFGDGISLKWFNLSNFSNYLSIPIAFIWFHKDIKKLNIKYSTCIESTWFYPFTRYPPTSYKIIKNAIESKYRETIKDNSNVTFFLSWTNIPTTFFYRNVLFVHKKNVFKNKDISLFKKFNCMKGSFRFGISLAIYLGFKNIYLIGFDYTHNPSRSHHWYERGRGIIKYKPEYDIEFINLAKKYSNIITITLDGGSKNFDYITYKDFTGKDPLFRENTKLVGNNNLKVLSTWGGYKIF